MQSLAAEEPDVFPQAGVDFISRQKFNQESKKKRGGWRGIFPERQRQDKSPKESKQWWWCRQLMELWRLGNEDKVEGHV